MSTVGDVRGTEVFYVLDDVGLVEGLYPPHFYRAGNHLAGRMLLEAPNDLWELIFHSPDGDTVQIVR